MVWLSLIWLGLRLLVGGLLVLAGSLKLSTHNGRRWLEPYQLLPAWMLPIAATTIAVAELVAGAALLLGAFGALSAVGAAALLLLVTSAAAITLLRGKRPPCGCFGGLSNALLSWRIVVRNVVFVGLMLCAAVVGSMPLNLNLAPLTEVIVVVAVAIGFAVGLPRLFNPRRISAPVGLPREAIH